MWVFAFPALAQATFAPVVSYTPGGSPAGVTVRDINGDGKADLLFAVGAVAPGRVAVLIGDGLGGSSMSFSFDAGSNPVAIAVGDFNRDGLADMAVSLSGTAQVAIILGTGTGAGPGAFAAPVNYAVGNSPNSIAVADFNGDGVADIAVSCQFSNMVSVLLGNGDGTFGAAASFPVGTAPLALAIGDFNGDGRPDLVTANSSSSNVSVLLGDGTGAFAAASNVATGNFVQSVVVADFNKDGKADLAVARSAGVTILLGNGDGTFGGANTFTAGSALRDLTVADFDGDGNLDVAAASSGGSVFVFLGNGAGSLGTPTSFYGNGNLRAIAFGDLNGDAKADLVVAGGTAGTGSVLMNTTAFAVTAQGWGMGDMGELGNGVFGANSASPVNVLNLDSIAAVSAGEQHTLALRADGTVWAWGADFGGPLGDGGTSVESAVPVQMMDFTQPAGLVPLTNVVAISAGGDHSLALRADGIVWSCGNNLHGQTGLGTGLIDTHAARPVPGIDDVIAISSGAAYNMALKSDGTVWAWGWNTNGQLGDGTVGIERHTPTQVVGLTNVIAIAATVTGWHSLAVKADGTVWAWGRNDRGQLGDGTTTDRHSPVQVSGLAGIRAVAAGSFHSVALKADGTVWAWGDNGHGQLGDGTLLERDTPVQVPSFAGVAVVTTGMTHTVVLKSDGTAWSWGGNGLSGQLGDGSFNFFDRTSPGLVLGISAATALSTAGQHSVVILKGMTTAAMIGMVQSMNLPQGTSNALTQTLSAAQGSYDKGNLTAACGQVGAFDNKVRAASGKQIPVADADRLLGASQRLGTGWGCRS
jgi:alpha-tubulin suppressor-like RCC1 family protein